MTKSITSILAVVASATVLAPTLADARAVSVSYRAHELATAPGRAAVIARVESTAKRACLGNRTAFEILRSKRCARKLGGEMVAQMKSPVMTALYLGRNQQIAAR